MQSRADAPSRFSAVSKPQVGVIIFSVDLKFEKFPCTRGGRLQYAAREFLRYCLHAQEQCGPPRILCITLLLRTHSPRARTAAMAIFCGWCGDDGFKAAQLLFSLFSRRPANLRAITTTPRCWSSQSTAKTDRNHNAKTQGAQTRATTDCERRRRERRKRGIFFVVFVVDFHRKNNAMLNATFPKLLKRASLFVIHPHKTQVKYI